MPPSIFNPKQSGIVLIFSLIMLSLLTIIGVTALQVTGLEEKMAGNNKDSNTAFQAAEAALRDAETDIKSSRVSGLTGMDASCSSGLCTNTTKIIHIESQAALVENAITYGSYSLEPNLVGIPAAQQPRYLIEGRKIKIAGSAAGFKHSYEITAIAQGGQSTTKKVINEVYIP
jgi:type IV pilus assembly protein PilX